MRRTAVLLALLVAVSVAAAPGARAGDAIRTSVDEGDRLLAAGEFGRAADVYAEIARDRSAAPSVRMRLAVALLKRELPAAALAAADAAVDAAPSADARGLRALARFRAGRFRAAEADRDLALAAPKGETGLARLADARLLASEGRFAEALAAVDAALAADSFLDRAFRFDEYALKSDVLDELDRQNDSLAAHEAALAAAPATNTLLRENLAAQLAFRRATLGTEFMRVAEGPASATLPIAMRQGIPIVYASLNGAAPAPFLLDTGAGVCVLFPKYAKKAGFKPRDERAWAGAVGGDGRVPIRFGVASRVGLGEITVENVPFAVIDWELPELAGIVGLPLLRPFTTTVDYRAKELRLDVPKPGAPVSTEAIGSTPFRYVGGAVFVEAEVNGHGPFNFELDTGASTEAVPIDLTVAEALGLSPMSATAKRTRGAGAGGTQEAYVYPDAKIAWAGLEPKSVALMSQRVTPARPERREGESGLVAETQLEGLIGYAVLARSAITIDFVARRVTVY